MKKIIAIMVICLAWGFSGCEKEIPRDPNADAQGHTPATPVTAAANEQVMGELPFSDEQDFADSRRGLIASDPGLSVKNAKGKRNQSRAHIE